MAKRKKDIILKTSLSFEELVKLAVNTKPIKIKKKTKKKK